MSAEIIDIGVATIVGAVIRLERVEMCPHQRQALTDRVARLAAEGNAAAALLHMRLLRATHRS